MSGIWLISYLVLWGFVIIEGVVIIALLRTFAGLHQRLEEQQEPQGFVRITPGSTLTDQQLTGLSGDVIRLSRLWQGGNLLVLFVSVDCAPCRNLLAWVGDAFRNGQLSEWDICVLCAGDETEVKRLVGETEVPLEIPIAAVDYASLRSQYHISATPTVAIVEEDGRIVDVVAGKVESYLGMLTRKSTFQTPASARK